MGSKRNEILTKLLLNSIIYENLLTTYKSEFYRHLIEDLRTDIKNIKSSNILSSQKKIKIKEIEKKIKVFNKRIQRVGELNCEITKEFSTHAQKNLNVEEFVDNTSDLFLAFTDTVFNFSNNMSKEEVASFIPTILHQVEKKESDISINNNFYKIIL